MEVDSLWVPLVFIALLAIACIWLICGVGGVFSCYYSLC